MTTARFRIAEQNLEINYLQQQAQENLLPSFQPFAYDGDETPMLHIYVDDDFDISTLGHEIGQFDCGGSNHGVYLTPDGGYQILISDFRGELCSKMQTNRDFTEIHVRLVAQTWAQRSYGLNNSVMMSYAFCTAPYGTLLLHASVIRCDGRGYLMTAPSGTGKSTHTHLWYKNIPGCDLMNDDNPVVRIYPDQAIVYGSPWSGKTPCYRNIQAPVGAMVRIKQMPENTIRRLKPVEAFATLLPAASSMKWDHRIYSAICDNITGLISRCGVWELGCLPDADAAILCHSTVTA